MTAVYRHTGSLTSVLKPVPRSLHQLVPQARLVTADDPLQQLYAFSGNAAALVPGGWNTSSPIPFSSLVPTIAPRHSFTSLPNKQASVIHATSERWARIRSVLHLPLTVMQFTTPSQAYPSTSICRCAKKRPPPKTKGGRLLAVMLCSKPLRLRHRTTHTRATWPPCREPPVPSAFACSSSGSKTGRAAIVQS